MFITNNLYIGFSIDIVSNITKLRLGVFIHLTGGQANEPR